jgi:cell wall-associated NlpC family hydrolase
MNRSRLSILILGTLLVLAGCSAAPRYRSKPAEVAPSDVDGREVVREAKRYIGTPYRLGGTTSGGLDCSGLVTTVYKKFGIAVPRTSREQAGFGQQISRSELKPGDLVFFRTNGGTQITHVGIYSGSGEFIHASTQWRRVKFDRLDNKYFSKRYATARRVL